MAENRNGFFHDSETLALRAKLAAKLAAVTRAIGALPHDGEAATGSGGTYQFTSYRLLNAHLRTLLPEHRLEVIPSVESVRDEYLDGGEGKRKFFRSLVTMKFLIVDTETGYAEERVFVGACNDTGDKSVGKAITEATKRFFFKLFHVSQYADRDPDEESGEPEDEPTPKREPRAPRKSDRKQEPEQKQNEEQKHEPEQEPTREQTHEQKQKRTTEPVKPEQETINLVTDDETARALLAAKRRAKRDIEALGTNPLEVVSRYAAKIGKTVPTLTAADYLAAVEWCREGGAQ